MLIELTIFFILMFIGGIVLGRWNKRRARKRLERKLAEAEARVNQKIEDYQEDLLEVANDVLEVGGELSKLEAKFKKNQIKAKRHKAHHQEKWLHWQVPQNYDDRLN